MKTSCQVKWTSATYGPRLFVVKELTSMRAGALPSCAMDLGGLCKEFQGGVGSSIRGSHIRRQTHKLIYLEKGITPKIDGLFCCKTGEKWDNVRQIKCHAQNFVVATKKIIKQEYYRNNSRLSYGKGINLGSCTCEIGREVGRSKSRNDVEKNQ